ncbi:MAG: hypothetical protein KKE53_16800, partial [Proteobacteria bacterium]|nr:hypothetical protein [Pseudomonadota bacterium]
SPRFPIVGRAYPLQSFFLFPANIIKCLINRSLTITGSLSHTVAVSAHLVVYNIALFQDDPHACLTLCTFFFR